MTRVGEYDGRTLIPPGNDPIVRVWDNYGGGPCYDIGDDRWLCEDLSGTLWLWLISAERWLEVSDSYWCTNIRDTWEPTWCFRSYIDSLMGRGGAEDDRVFTSDLVESFIVLMRDAIKTQKACK
jgi:hypothetical protein